MNLEQKKIHVEYKRVNAAREELECRVLEMEDNIKRLQESIEIQKKKEDELLLKIKEFDLSK